MNSTVAPLPPCPDGGEEWGDSCYSFYSEEQTKQEAEGICSGTVICTDFGRILKTV